MCARLGKYTSGMKTLRSTRTMSEQRRATACALPSKHKMKVAVIGAGAAGLVAARELRREGHEVKVFEQSPRLGGIWRFDERTEEDDPLGTSDARQVVHSSMYASLRTNLPRELMGFSDMPFVPEFMNGRSQDGRRFCGHEEVLRYLENFTEVEKLEPLVTYSTRVVAAHPSADDVTRTADWSGPCWTISTTHADASSASNQGAASRIEPSGRAAATGAPEASGHPSDSGRERANAAAGTSTSYASGTIPNASHSAAASGSESADRSIHTETYNAVVVCNGHYSVPNVPPTRGLNTFPGTCMHSHNYRYPEPFAGLNVLLVGAHVSGEDIAVDLSPFARSVVLSAKSWMDPEWALDARPFGPNNNITRRPMVAALERNGDVVLEDGSVVTGVDVIMFCTGYKYRFPFLEDTAIVDTSRSHVEPLYQHLFPPAFAPTLSFIGLPFKVVPFPQFELQSKLVARVLSGRSRLPSQAEMEQHTAALYRSFEEAGVKDRHYHLQGPASWDYNDWLAQMCGDDVPITPEWRRQMMAECSSLRRSSPHSYRDEWHQGQSTVAAHAEFETLKAGDVLRSHKQQGVVHQVST